MTLPDTKNILWVMVNKPKDLLTTLDDDKERNTILTIIPKAKDLHLVPIGRMERDATGLLLLTNEVGWVHPLTHPSFQITKRYLSVRVTVYCGYCIVTIYLRQVRSCSRRNPHRKGYRACEGWLHSARRPHTILTAQKIQYCGR